MINLENRKFSYKDSGETRTMRTKSDNIEIMMCSETDEIIKGLYVHKVINL